MNKGVPALELKDRMNRFRSKMDQNCPGWNWAIIFSKVNQYYFTGTMQDGMLIIPKMRRQYFGYGGVMNVHWRNHSFLVYVQ